MVMRSSVCCAAARKQMFSVLYDVICDIGFFYYEISFACWGVLRNYSPTLNLDLNPKEWAIWLGLNLWADKCSIGRGSYDHKSSF